MSSSFEVEKSAGFVVNRRTALETSVVAGCAALLGTLAGCSSSASQAPTSSASATPPSALTSPTPTVTPTPTPTPTSAAFDPQALTKLRTRLAHVKPTQWGMDISGIKQLNHTDTVSLTLDACGGPGGSKVDRELLDYLRTEKIPATLFLNQRWIHANEKLAVELAADPLFEIGNHGTLHCPLTVNGRAAYGIPGTADVDAAIAEVGDNHRTLFQLTGVEPRWFRSGTAHYDDVGVQICSALGETPVGFSINADGGATFNAQQVLESVLATSAGGILIGHFNQPDGDTAEGLKLALPRLLKAGLKFGFLS